MLASEASANFTLKELSCSHCGAGPQPQLIIELQRLRDAFGSPMLITSATRCKEHNAAVGGAPNSMHLQGLAVDVGVPKHQRWDLVRHAMAAGVWRGIGVNKEFIHLDLRTSDPAVWVYGSNGKAL